MKENKMVMRQIYTWILSAAIPLLASCTQDELPGNVVPPGNSLYISSATLTSGGHTQTEAVTRASATDVPVSLTKGSLGIFRSKGTGYTSTLDNLQYTYTGADKGWQPATAADTLFLNGDDADVCAYYPYNSDTEYSDKTALPLASGKYAGNTTTHDPMDFCYATNRTLNGARRATTFELKHAMAMLELKITKDADYKGDCRITSVSILNPELINNSRINITDGIYTTMVKGGVQAYNPGTDADGILIGNASTTTAALLVPFTPTTAGVTISFAVNGVPVEAVIPNDKMPKVEDGHRYTANIVMKATSMQVTGVDMMPWEETGVGGDDYTWYPTEDVIKLTTPIHIASYDWAWSNLEKGDVGYTLGSYQKLAGSLWAWNVLEPMTPPVKKGDIPSPNTGTYLYAQDPCSKLSPEGTWTLPNQHQIDLLFATDHVNTATGCWFGTSTAISENKDDGTYLFLPANNLLTYHGFVSDKWLTELNEGMSGYWLCENDNPRTTMLTVGTHANMNGVAPYVGEPFTDTTTLYGGSVRCVQKARETISIAGVEWAMGNLVEKAPGAYVISDYQTKVPLTSSSNWADAPNGYYFAWNSLTSNLFPGEIDYDYDISHDPCAQVSPTGTWRTPTKEEFDKAMALGIVYGTYTINGVTMKGYYLGTNTQPAKGGGDEFLFLPEAGGGDSQSNIYFNTYYWTSTEGSGTNVYSFSNGYTSANKKNFLANVRCVKN